MYICPKCHKINTFSIKIETNKKNVESPKHIRKYKVYICNECKSKFITLNNKVNEVIDKYLCNFLILSIVVLAISALLFGTYSMFIYAMLALFIVTVLVCIAYNIQSYFTEPTLIMCDEHYEFILIKPNLSIVIHPTDWKIIKHKLKEHKIIKIGSENNVYYATICKVIIKKGQLFVDVVTDISGLNKNADLFLYTLDNKIIAKGSVL